MENWRSLRIGEFSISIPEGGAFEISNDGLMLSVRFPTEPATELLVSSFSMKSVEEPDVPAALKELLEDFCNRSIASVLGYRPSRNIVCNWDPSRLVINCQAVVLFGEDNSLCWLIRSYWKRGEDHYYLLHWNGSRHDARGTVLEVMESFDWHGESTQRPAAGPFESEHGEK